MKFFHIVMSIAALNFNYCKEYLFLCRINFHNKIICTLLIYVIQVHKQLLMEVNRNKERLFGNTFLF